MKLLKIGKRGQLRSRQWSRVGKKGRNGSDSERLQLSLCIVVKVSRITLNMSKNNSQANKHCHIMLRLGVG
jgi:hypothetical protein